jgi:hypothetical protein
MRSARRVFLCVAALTSAVGCGGTGTEKVDGQTPPGDVLVQGVLEVPLTPEDVAALPAGFAETAKTFGWIRTEKGFELVVPISRAVLLYAGREAPPSDSKGFIPESAVRPQPRGVLPSLKTLTGAVPLTPVKDAATAKTVYRLTQTFGGSSDCCRKSGLQVPEAVRGDPMEGRCLDYNGTYTDGTNYPRSDQRAYKNFVGSDCNLAMLAGHCFADHLNGGCYKNHGSKLCSDLIGHSSAYHTH